MLGGLEQADDVVMGDGNAFGHAGGAGGVDDVGGVGGRGEGRGVFGGKRGEGGEVAVAADDGGGDVAELREECGVGEDDRSLGVGEDEAEALAGRIGIKRDVSAAGFEDGEEGDEEGGGAFEAQRDERLRADAEGAEVVGEAVGLGVEFAVGEVLLFESQRDGVRGGAGVRLEQLVDAAFRREGARGGAGRRLTHAAMGRRHGGWIS
jgi:hypothetical protein